MANRKYVVNAADNKKLRELVRKEVQAAQLATTCMTSGDVEGAKQANLMLQRARADQESFFNKLLGWHENGVPKADYAV